MATFFMARDQYGQTYHDLGPHPRKALLARLGRSKAVPMYQDKTNGALVKTGWVIGGQWLTLYRVEPVEKAVS